MDAFWGIYTARRIEKITVKEITAKAGCNRGTFYEYHSKYYSVLLGANGDPAFSSKLKKQIKASLTEHFKEKIQDAQEFDYTLEYILSTMVGFMSYWFSQQQNISKERLMGLIHNLSEQGIGTILPL